MRARIDVSEIEAKTKIRAKYLRALENEEWGLLPGPTFVKSFLRTYAQALGLDGKALVEEYRLNHESPADTPLEPIVSTTQRRRRAHGGRPGRGGGDGPSRAYVIAVSAIGLVIVVLVALLIAGGGGGSNTGSTGTARRASTHTIYKGSRGGSGARRTARPASQVVALSLHPTAVVYVCLIGDGGRKLIPGIELQPGENTPTYYAKRFEITLGNSSVTMIVDGTPRTVAPSSEAIGYSITKATGRVPLQPGQMPTCT